MKQTTPLHFKKWIKLSLLAVVALFIGCQKDLYEDSIQQSSSQHKQPILKSYDWKGLEKNLQFQDAYRTASKKWIEKQSTSREMYGVSVDTSYIIETIKEEYKAYSIKILSEEDSQQHYKNLIIELDSLDNVAVSIVDFYKDPAERLDSMRVEYLIPKVIYENYDLSRCVYFEVIVFVPCSGDGHHNIFQDCPIANGEEPGVPAHIGTEIATYCPSISGNPTAPTIHFANFGPQTNGGSHGGTFTINPGLTPAQIKIKEFHDALDNINMLNCTGDSCCFNSMNSNIKSQLDNLYATVAAGPSIDEEGTVNFQNVGEVMQFTQMVIAKVCANPGVFSNIAPFLIEKQIDASELNDCMKDIINTVKGSQQNDFATIFATFTDSNKNFLVKMKPDPTITNPAIRAQTNWLENPIQKYRYGIGFRNGYITSSTKLGIAATVLHEFIHAYFLSLVDQGSLTPGGQFNALWLQYVFNGTPSGTNNIQHEEMVSNLYVNAIAKALQEYDTGIPVNTMAFVDQVYIDLAWMGLQDTYYYQHHFTAEEKDRMQAVSDANDTNIPRTSGGVNYYPQGTPCP